MGTYIQMMNDIHLPQKIPYMDWSLHKKGQEPAAMQRRFGLGTGSRTHMGRKWGW